MSESVSQCKCPFKSTIMTRQFGCEKAQQITRREGPDVTCDSDQAAACCVDIFETLKKSCLPEMGYEDDLLSMPASVLQKIQFGGLLAIQQLVNAGSDVTSIENIYRLVRDAVQKYGATSNIPYSECVEAVSSYKLKKRRR